MKIFVVALLAFLVSACGFKTIDTGNVGIPTTFGKITGEPVTEGLHFYNPFSSQIHELDTHVLVMTAETAAYTKDVQVATLTYVINYQLRKADAANVYAKFGVNWAQSIIPQIILGTIKEVVGQWDAVDLVKERQKAGEQIANDVTATLASKSIDVSRFELTGLAYTDAFDKAIEEKVIAQQSAIREQNHTVEIQNIANQTVISAKAEAESMEIRAKALEQNPKLVEWAAVQKWNGQLPQVSGGATPFISLGK